MTGAELSYIALYTATMGKYERPFEILPEAGFTSNHVDCFRFTDSQSGDYQAQDHETTRHWKEIVETPRLPGDPIRSARAVKILGHHVLSSHDVTVWIDNRVRLKVGIDELVDRFLPSDADIALPLHSYHRTLADEFNAVLSGRFDDPRAVRDQRQSYLRHSPLLATEPVYWTAILIRRNNDAVRRFNTIWWENVLRYSRRDQLSFPFAQALSPDVIVSPIEIDNFESDVHEWRKVSSVGRAPGAGHWRPASLRSELADTTKSIQDELVVRGRAFLRDSLPPSALRRARVVRTRTRQLWARST